MALRRLCNADTTVRFCHPALTETSNFNPGFGSGAEPSVNGSTSHPKWESGVRFANES